MTRFEFEHMYPQDWNRRELGRTLTVRLVKLFLAGKSCVVATYGGTGTGKTHTLYNQDTGLIRAVIADLLPRTGGQLSLSAVCLYQDQCLSLFSPSSKSISSLDDAHSVLSSLLLSSPKLASRPSRAHSILTLSRPNSPVSIHWIDLPGREKVRSSWANSLYLDETNHINHSLDDFERLMTLNEWRNAGNCQLTTTISHKISKI